MWLEVLAAFSAGVAVGRNLETLAIVQHMGGMGLAIARHQAWRAWTVVCEHVSGPPLALAPPATVEFNLAPRFGPCPHSCLEQHARALTEPIVGTKNE